MYGDRGIRRARLACLNCRRKKTRCQGDGPTCALCVRLGQRCEYAAPGTASSMSSSAQNQSSPPRALTNEDLAARVAKLEEHLRAAQSKLSESRDTDGDFNVAPSNRALSDSSPEKVLTPPQPQSQQQGGGTSQWSTTQSGSEGNKQFFPELPPVAILKSLVDVYFANCHNQPYAFFHESSLRRALAADEIPQYLLLAIAATAVRYSTHDHFRDRQLGAAETLARASWVIILDQVFGTEATVDISAAQATALLAVIDFTAGHSRLGWVKIGLAIRLVQDLKLNAEPDSTLPLWQQEERRRVFWSVYLLDRFVSCGKSRPLAILDVDCTVSLPCSESAFRMEIIEKMPTLAIFQEAPSKAAVFKELDQFAILVLMCSMLGIAIRETFQPKPASLPPWDCRSAFAKISSIMLTFENIHAVGATQLGAYILDRFGTYEGFDRQRVGHFIWARSVYHLCGCLLYHPLNMYKHRQAYGAAFPSTFARECLGRVQEHASQLSNILQILQTTGCCARGSFLGYLATCAASVHLLHVQSPNQETATQAVIFSEICLGFLEQLPVCWPNYNLMATALKELDTDPGFAQLLISSSEVEEAADADSSQTDDLWQVIDYGIMSDPRRKKNSKVNLSSSMDLSPDAGSWGFFEDPLAHHKQSFLGLALPDLINEL